MNMLTIVAITWIGKEYRFLGLDWSYLMVLGFIGNALFSMRFLVQWLASERQGESIIPVSFWYWSIAGSALLCLKFFTVAQVHQFYAHRVATGFANFFDPGAHHLAFVRDQHNLVCFANCERANHVAGFLAGSHRDDAFAAA